MARPTRHPAAASPAKAAVSKPAPVGRIGQRERAKALEHELRVHQVELEMQNEELRRTQLDLAAACDRYLDLYDFAPVAYLTLDADDAIVEASLTAATLQGEPRETLLKRRFAHFVCEGDADRWHRLRLLALQPQGPQRVELTLQPRPGALLHGQLDCVRVAPDGAAPMLRLTLSDITQRKQAEIDHRVAATAIETRGAERRRIARELHEELGQRLGALKMGLTSLRTESPQPVQAQRIGEMLETLDESVAMVRRIATDLPPSMLDDLGLNAAIDWLVRDSAQRLGLAIAVRLPDVDPPLDERRTIALYRLLQETLASIARHGYSTKIEIDMQLLSRELVLTAQSDGARAPGTTDRRDATEAVQTLHQQARLLGGRLALDDGPGRGQRYTPRLSLPEAADAHEPNAIQDSR